MTIDELVNGQVQTQSINVDDASDPELEAIATHPGVHKDVQRYARLILSARKPRRAGNIAMAMIFEDKANRVYELDIPKRLQW